MSKKERTHEYLCEHVLDEYVTGICNGKRFCFRVDAIKKLTQDGIAISDGEKDGWWVFLLWEELERMFDCEAVDVRAEATYHGSYDGYAITECRFVRSDESLEDLERECEQDGITVGEWARTRGFGESKGLLTDRTEDNEPQDSEPKGRKASDIVEDCWRSVSNAFSDMLWDLREHPVRPSLAIEANDATTATLETLARLAAEYKGMEEGV